MNITDDVESNVSGLNCGLVTLSVEMCLLLQGLCKQFWIWSTYCNVGSNLKMKAPCTFLCVPVLRALMPLAVGLLVAKEASIDNIRLEQEDELHELCTNWAL